MGPQGVVNTLKTAFGATKKEWEAEKAAEAARRGEDSLAYAPMPAQSIASTGGTHDTQKGPAMAAVHDPNAAYKATQSNVKNAIMQVSKQPGAAIAQKELHKQAAQDFAKSHGIDVKRFMELSPEAQKDVMASDDPIAKLKSYSGALGYWAQKN